jgi:cytochrome c553
LSLSVSESSLAKGEELYLTNCVDCHGQDGRGVHPGTPDFTLQQTMAAKSALDLFQVISNGASQVMPGFADQLSEDDRWALANYLRSFTFTTVLGASVAPTPVVSATVSLTSTAQLSLTQSLGSISGLVVNASGGDTPAGFTVNLHGFDNMQVVITGTTTTADDGSYIFPDIAFTPDRLFLTTVEYQQVTYGSEVGSFEAGQTNLDLPIQVYQTTTDASVLVTDRVHFFFEMADTNTLRVVELYVISNPVAKTLIAAESGQPVVTFSLPKGAANLEFQDGNLGERYVLTDDGFGDTLPVRSGVGSYQVMFSYELPYNHKLDLVRPVNMATSAVVILVPEDGFKITGIQDGGVRDVQGMSYHLYNGDALQPGQEIHLTISDNVRLLPSGSSTNLLFGLGALGVVLIGAGVWLYRRNLSMPHPDAAKEDAQILAAAESPETVMDAILALDDLYQAGELPEEAYIERRNELRAHLKELMGKE